MNHFSFLSFFLTVLLSFLWMSPRAVACDNSSLELLGITDNGTSYDITVRLCIGGGVLGGVSGADDATGTFAFAFYAPGLVINSFPASLTSDTTGCVQPATTFTGSFGADMGVAYINTGGCSYTCVSSTAVCGQPHSDCEILVFNTNILPDSIRLLGAEGNGNPIAGCYPNADMLLNFSALLPIEWEYLHAGQKTNQIQLDWGIIADNRISSFRIERKAPGSSWIRSGQVEAKEGQTAFSWQEEAAAGQWQYRVFALTEAGDMYVSPVAELSVDKIFSLALAPNPAKEEIFLPGTWTPGDHISIFNSHGQEVMSMDISSFSDHINLQTGKLPQGIYSVTANQSGIRKEAKMMILP